MIRRAALIAGFALGAAVLVAALLWIARLTARLEAGETEARRLAAQEERVRLALWRMDSALATFLALENARPVDPPADAARPADPAWIAERFEIASAGPAPVPGQTRAPEPAAGVAADPRAGRAPVREAVRDAAQAADPPSARQPPVAIDPAPRSPPPAAPLPAMAGPVKGAPPPATQRESEIQQQLNVVEFEQRQKFAEQQSTFVPGVVEPPAPTRTETAQAETTPGGPAEPDAGAAPETTAGAPPEETESRPAIPPDAVAEPAVPEAVAAPRAAVPVAPVARLPAVRGPTGVLQALEPRWEEPGRLVLARRIVRDGVEAEQGIVLDDAVLRAWLLAEVGDLVPGSGLEPAPAAAPEDPGRRLALLPLRLVPGPPPALPEAGLSPARIGLWTAIGAILLVAAAAALTLVSRLRLARRRTEFASAVIHELRTPLTTFRVTTELLAEDMVPPAERPEHLRTLRGEADRLARLVENVLAFARLERRAGPPARRLALAPWLGETVERLERRAAADGLELRLEVAPSAAGVEVEADPVALERILDNLCDNSCKYARDTDPPRIEVTASTRGRHAVVRWRDHGPGIAPAARRRLFRPYRRGAAAETSAVPGVGLGLALSRRIARRFGGDLHCAETAGRGAAFELLLPRLSGPA